MIQQQIWKKTLNFLELLPHDNGCGLSLLGICINLGICWPGFKGILYVLELSVVKLAKDKSNLHSFRVDHSYKNIPIIFKPALPLG